LATPDAGGIGADWRAAYPVLRGIGYWQAPLPLAETAVASLLLSLAGIELPGGPLVLVESELDGELRVSDGARPKLDGEARRVSWARHGRWAVVSSARGIGLVDLRDAASVSIDPFENHARIPADTVRFADAPLLEMAANPLPDLQHPVRTLGAIARAAMMVGALEAILEKAVDHAGNRVQFGRPIGRNQAIQQQLALLAGDVAASRVAALVAASDAPWAGDRNCRSTAFSAAVAKIRCGEAATQGCSIAHQVHGAIGFSYEHSLNFATRRLWAWREEFGADAWWAERLGRAAIAGGSAHFWADL